eukprot:CAMPEP_0167826260 /NCGR_PEP_ID=MMETSP0112_2-20121227/9910_1 /TAXON_ID=91324 /ORGANISM="Lotharella globosa, Strain CCCM811" /LENGTH=297 /DNA_ID=CAMNT_0007728633 /DNA_START=11 /DNA_END=904 /DNA_ORIENTATION=+
MRYDSGTVDLSMSKREIQDRRLLMKKHYDNMSKIKPTLNTRDGEFHKRWTKFRKYAKMNKAKLVRGQEIRRANAQLIEKITDIATKPSGQYSQEYPSKQRMFMTILAEHGRKMRQEKITKENQLLAERLLSKSSSYDRREWEKDWKRHDHVLAHLSKSSQMGITGSPKSRASSRAVSRAGSRANSRAGSRANSLRKLSSKSGISSKSASRKGSDRLVKAGMECLKNKTITEREEEARKKGDEGESKEKEEQSRDEDPEKERPNALTTDEVMKEKSSEKSLDSSEKPVEAEEDGNTET